jgi:hypothetical protein
MPAGHGKTHPVLSLFGEPALCLGGDVFFLRNDCICYWKWAINERVTAVIGAVAEAQTKQLALASRQGLLVQTVQGPLTATVANVATM